jgi:hypothetical protein
MCAGARVLEAVVEVDGGQWRAGGLAGAVGGKEGSSQLASLLASPVLVEPSCAGPT